MISSLVGVATITEAAKITDCAWPVFHGIILLFEVTVSYLIHQCVTIEYDTFEF